MKVFQVMHRRVDYVTPSAQIKEVAKLIFGHHINGVPVLKGKKVVGFITERDILKKFYPRIDEYMEDPVNASKFEIMEKKVSEIFEIKAGKIMSKHPVTVGEDEPVLKAQSLMFVHEIGRLPVVNKAGNMVGIITNGDIFKKLVGKKAK